MWSKRSAFAVNPTLSFQQGSWVLTLGPCDNGIPTTEATSEAMRCDAAVLYYCNRMNFSLVVDVLQKDGSQNSERFVTSFQLRKHEFRREKLQCNFQPTNVTTSKYDYTEYTLS